MKPKGNRIFKKEKSLDQGLGNILACVPLAEWHSSPRLGLGAQVTILVQLGEYNPNPLTPEAD